MTADGVGAPNEVRNATSGPVQGVVQAGSVHGDVHLHVDRADQRTVPRQLLPSPACLVGRQRELAWLDEVRDITSDAPVIVILKGSGGVGKTALATQWFRKSEHRFPDGQLYANLTDATGAPVASEDVLGQFLRALGTDPRNVPLGLAERAALYRSITARRTVAVLLDNAVSVAQVHVLVPTSPTSMVVVTSRRTLLGLVTAGALVLDVRPLDVDSSVELLGRRLGHDRVTAEGGHARELASLCDGLPIALNVAAAITMVRPNRLLARTVRQLREERYRLNRLSMDSDTSVRATLDTSYSRLSPAAATTYRAMGSHPGATFCVQQVAGTTAVETAIAWEVMDELADANLVEELRDGYYRFHDLIRVHAREQAGDGDELVVRRLLEWYLKVTREASRLVLPARRKLSYQFEPAVAPFAMPTEMADRTAALRWLEDEHLNLVAATRAAADRGFHTLAYSLADAFQPLVIAHRQYLLEVEIDSIALGAALAEGSRSAEIDVRTRLSRYCARLGRLAEAQHHADVLMTATREWGDRLGEARGWESQAVVLVAAGHHDRAVDVYVRMLAILSELGDVCAEGLASTDLGDILVTLGRWGDAIPLLERAMALLSGLPEPDIYNVARAAIVLAAAHIGTGNDLTAADLLRSALPTMTEHGNPVHLARAHRSLAGIARRAGDEAAVAHHDRLADRLTDSPGLPGPPPERRTQ